MKMNADLKVFMDFKGFGDPMGDFWFIGIEEGDEFSPEEMNSLINRYSRGIVLSRPGEFKERIYPVYKKIVDIVTGVRGYDEKWYRNERVFVKGSEAFLSNLYPLGKKRSSAPLLPHYFDQLDLKSEADYYEIVKTYRYPIIKNFWEYHNPKITICFGKSGWSEFRRLFELKETDRVPVVEGVIEYYPDEKIYLTHHFSIGRMDRYAYTNKLVNHFKKVLGN